MRQTRPGVAFCLRLNATDRRVLGVNEAPSARKLINELGGTQVVAERLHIEPRTVQMWKFRRRIPRQRWPEILEHFPAVTLDALRASEAQGE